MLYLKDINLPRPDKYDTCMLIAFLQQLQTFGGFYDENLEFLRLERVHVSGSSENYSALWTSLFSRIHIFLPGRDAVAT